MQYAKTTYLESQMPWGFYSKGRALCPDGKVRTLKRIAESADTFFSVPAAVTYKGKTVAGYVTVETIQGYSTPDALDPLVVKFIPYKYGKNGALFNA
jgi:hypothetical protein